jgi:hypothetical protein
MSADRIRRLAADARLARQAGFWWGLAEGVAFFVVPDVYISFAALFALRAGAIAWAASIAGSLVAVVGIRVLMLVPGLDYLALLDAIPGISAGLIQRVAEGIRAAGLPYTPFLVLGGVPLKLYAALAFRYELPLGAVLLWTVVARVVRIAPTFLVLAAVRRLLERRIDSNPGAWLTALVLFWVAFYALYFERMGRA